MADAKLEKLLQQKKQLDAKVRNALNRDIAKRRKAETRKKIVLGGAVLALEKKKQEISMAAILAYIEETARDTDKALFPASVAAVREDAPA